MQRFLLVRGLAATAALVLPMFFAGCGGSGSSVNNPTQIVLSPTTLSLNQGAVGTLSAVAEDSSGNTIAADLTFTSSNNSVATVSPGGLVCGGTWDSAYINCNFTSGQGVGQATITVTATAFPGITATTTVYVHEEVDQVQVVLGAGCTTMGQPVNIAGEAFSTTAPGCSPASPCNITSTVGPFSFGSNNSLVAANSSGIVTTYNSATATPTYTSGGTISGSKGQTCDLSNFNGVNNATATVALTGSNTIASGTQLTITNAGYGAVNPPTTATLSNGSATCSGTADVNTAITSGVLTAEAPGTTTVFASVAGVNSVGTNYLTCPVHSIVVHSSVSGATSFTIAPTDTESLTADVYDTNGTYIMPTLTWGSSFPAAATVATGTSGNNPATVTAVTGGSTYITATCTSPSCNIGVPSQYSENIVTINVTTPTSTTAYAASTNSTSLVPINTSSNAAGTAIALPYTPNSILASPSGTYLYLGSSSGLMVVEVSTGTVTSYSGVAGNVIAISPSGQYLLVSNSSSNNLFYFNAADNTIIGTLAGTSTASAYTPDSGLNQAIFTTSTNPPYQVELALPSPISTFALPSQGTAIDLAAQGGLTYFTSSSGAMIYVYSTCNQSSTQVLGATSPTLIKAIPNATGAVAVDSPNIDVIATPTMFNSGCPITTQSSITGYNLNAGSFTARQMLVSSDATHAYIITNLPQVLSFDLQTLSPGSASLIGGAIAASGGITLDGSRIYVGTSDTSVHQIDTASMTDAARIFVGLTDGNGNPTVPNLVTVIP